MAEKIEDSPEFRKALQEECEKQYRSFLYGGNVPKGKVGGTPKEVQRQRREIEEKVEGARIHADRVRREAELMSNEGAREIIESLRRIHGQNGGLICPQCGDSDHHNRMNGKPWCMSCNLPLMSKEKAEKWVKPQPNPEPELTFKPFDHARMRR
jgi:hypothetical protein